MYALFNNEKKFIGYSPDEGNHPNIFKIKIPQEQSDIRLWQWEGNYDDGKMVPLDIGYPRDEMEMEIKLFEYIEKKYPITIQILNIIKQLRKLVQYDKHIQDYEFMDMSDSIINAVDKQLKRVSYYKNYERHLKANEIAK